MQRAKGFLATLAAATVALSGIATADQLVGDADALVTDPGSANVVNASQAEGTTVSYTFGALITETGNSTNDVFPGSLAVSVARTGAWLADPAGSPESLSFTGYSVTQTGTISITVPECTASDTRQEMTVVLTAGTSTNGNVLASNGDTVTLEYRITAVDGDSDCGGGSTNSAPVVSSAAADALGVEGDTLATSGAFSDPDDDALTLTADNGSVGTFTDNGDGTWDWSLGTTDDVAVGTITVTATDPAGATATDAFDYSASNADPVLGTITATPTGACSVSFSASFSDVGTADTHVSNIDWGDGSPDGGADPATSPISDSHTYTTTGTKTITVSVTDDDGGSDSDATSSFTTKNTPSAFLAPINTGSGPRSVFKLGSTIPVKISVSDCAGAPVTNLTPTVQLQRVDSVADGSINEPQIAEVPTNGKAMAWNGEHYHYVLSTKKSQHFGSALPQGTYRLWVTDPSFYSSPIAHFDLR